MKQCFIEASKQAAEPEKDEPDSQGFEGCIQQRATCISAGVCLGPRRCPNSPMRIVQLPWPEEDLMSTQSDLSDYLGEACLRELAITQ